jgi:asparagine synthase (glutamine-hydrolysing)
MCGIAGIIKFREQIRPADLNALERMTAAQTHRGPDDSGSFHDSRVALGHRRLSIIDVSAAGRQPMSNENGTVWVTYNGEIYNYAELRESLLAAGHRFCSQSDTEVLVHGYEEWGEKGLLRKLRGMFAFAIYDSERGRVIVARDRLGIKPLYYFFDQRTGLLGFASEVKALMESGMVPRQTDRKALAGFLLLGSVPSPRTIVRDVTCLLPGHYLVAERGAIRSERYWDLNFVSTAGTDPARLSEILRTATRRHLMSDVPLGVFLSGGVDSAGLVALACQESQRLKTLTISFAESAFNETREARRLAEHFGTEHQELRVSAADFVNELPNILAAMDQPTHDGVNTYFVAKAARAAGLTVVLSGLGGDELFWGYRHYRWMARNWGSLKMFAAVPAVVQRACISGAVALGRWRGQEAWMRLAALRSGLAAEDLYLAFRGFFPAEQAQRLLGNSQAEMNSLLGDTIEEFHPVMDESRTNRLNYIEIKRYLHDQLLRDTDVFGMAHSVEVRVPYLDDEVVALAAALPGNLKTDGAMNKPLLVDAIGDSLIAEAARRPKRGFSFPLGEWMRARTGQMREMAMETNLLERDAVGKLWSAFEEGRLHWSRAWSLVVLGARA